MTKLKRIVKKKIRTTSDQCASRCHSAKGTRLSFKIYRQNDQFFIVSGKDKFKCGQKGAHGRPKLMYMERREYQLGEGIGGPNFHPWGEIKIDLDEFNRLTKVQIGEEFLYPSANQPSTHFPDSRKDPLKNCKHMVSHRLLCIFEPM